MNILVLDPPEGKVVGLELQFGAQEAEFLLQDDGTVMYHSPDNEKTWFAGSSVEAFQKAAECWNQYIKDVSAAKTEERQLAVVTGLRSKLECLGVLNDSENSVWAVFVVQAEYGHL